MNTQVRIAAFFAVTLALAACGHSTTVPPSSSVPTLSNDTASQTRSVSSNTGGTFVQYALPAGANAFDLAHGPYGTLWFTTGGIPPHVFQFVTSTGAFHKFTVPNPFPSGVTFQGGPAAIISAGGAVWFFEETVESHDTWLVRVTPAGAFSLFLEGVPDSPIPNLVVGSDGRIWFTECLDGDCINNAFLTSRSTNGVGGPGGLVAPLLPSGLTPGPGGNLYVTGTIEAVPLCVDICGAVDVFTTAGVKIHEFLIQAFVGPEAIVTGSDHNLWITEGRANKIARMTPTGAVTEFSVPTANAGLNRITYGWDKALWFTETRANKIGRITTTGSVTEYTIPVANAEPTGIVVCSSTTCPPHGGVWFAEPGINKIGKFIAP